MIDIVQWRASVGLFHCSTSRLIKFACFYNLFIHMLFAFHLHFLPLLVFIPFSMLIIYLSNVLSHRVQSNHWLLLLNALLLWNLSNRLNTLSGDIHPNPGPNIPDTPASHNSTYFSVVHLNIRSLLATQKTFRSNRIYYYSA